MNISKYIGKTFPAGKMITELGLDLSRKFVVVVGDNTFNEGDVLVSIDSFLPCFKRLSDGKKAACFPSQLAYLEEEDEKIEYTVDPEKDVDTTDFLSGMNYVPRVGDRIRLEGVVRAIDEDGDATIRMAPNSNSGVNILVFSSDFQQLTLVSRASRTLTKAEAERILVKHLNESITIL